MYCKLPFQIFAKLNYLELFFDKSFFKSLITFYVKPPNKLRNLIYQLFVNWLGHLPFYFGFEINSEAAVLKGKKVVTNECFTFLVLGEKECEDFKRLT